LKRAELCCLKSLKQLVLDNPEQQLELLFVAGCRLLSSLRLLSRALTTLAADGCYRLQVSTQ
jgi:hypothetical protein